MSNDTLRMPAREEAKRPAFRPDPKVLAAIEGDVFKDHFSYDAKKKPEDMVYEGKRLTVAGWEDKQHQMAMKARGWSPVKTSRHPECATEDPSGENIIIGGLILMERHKVYCDAAAKIPEEKNRAQVSGQFERLQLGGSDHMPRRVIKANQTYESGQEIPA